jgi:hypothetical protein
MSNLGKVTIVNENIDNNIVFTQSDLTKGQFPNCRSLDSITFSNFTQEEIAT